MPRQVIALLFAVLMTTSCGAQQSEGVDLIVTNAVIHTMDSETPSAGAMAISEGRIVALGPGEAILAEHRGRETHVLDVDGKTIVPGLIDAHVHVMSMGAALRSVDVVGTTSVEEIAATVAGAAAERGAGGWILGRGWDQNDWEVKAFPTHEALDVAAPDHPVSLGRIDGHAIWVNERAMEIAGITPDTPDPEGGRIVRDLAGDPTGVFVDKAMGLIFQHIPRAGDVERAARLAAAQDHMVSLGLTGVHDMGTGRATLELMDDWAGSDRLSTRVIVYLNVAEEGLLDWWEAEGAGVIAEDPRGRLVVRGVKLYADGALGSRGAALIEPYSDDPGNVGLLTTPPEELTSLTTRVVSMDLQPAIHAIGDLGNRVALDAIAASSAETATPRPRIEHAQIIALDDIPRFEEGRVVASVQPTHATSDMYWAEDRVGPDRIQGAYAWRKLIDSGAELACGSDFPVENANPFHGLYAAVERKDQAKWPEGGWYVAEALSREEALACFTIDAAKSAGLEADTGSLSVGKYADFLILDRDYMTVPEDEIWRIRVLRTVIGGETVFEASQADLAR